MGWVGVFFLQLCYKQVSIWELIIDSGRLGGIYPGQEVRNDMLSTGSVNYLVVKFL